MTDRTVKVRLEADISDFVTDIGVKAPAAVKRLEVAASKANYRLKQTTADVGSNVEMIGSKAASASAKITKFGAVAQAANSKVGTSASKASRSIDEVATSTSKADKSTADMSKTAKIAAKDIDAHANAVGRLRTAQLRLAEVQASSKPSASGLAGAEESVASAQRAVNKFEKVGNDSGKSFGAGFKKWLTGSGEAIFQESGRSGGRGILGALMGALKTPVLGPILLTTLLSAVAVAAPAAGAVAGGALVAGIGAGLAGLGIMFAAQSRRVSHVWSKTMTNLGGDMLLLSAPFEGTLNNIAGYFERTVNRFSPALSAAFMSMAGPIDTFVNQAMQALEKLIPAIGPITDAFNAVLAGMGPALQTAIGSISEALITLSQSISANPTAMADLITGLGSITATTLGLITTLSNVNSSFSDLTGGVSLVTVALKGIESIIYTLEAPFTFLSAALAGVNALFGITGKDSDTAGKSMSDAANKTVELAQANGGLAAAAQHAAPPLQMVTDALSRQKNQFSAAIEAMGQWTTAALGNANAAIAYQAAIDNVSASIKDNGRTHDINTEKGRNNKTALLQVAEAANKQTIAMDDAGKSNVSVAVTAEKSRAQFIKLATQMGYTVPEAKAMAAAMINIPNVSREAKLTANKKDLETKLAAAKRELADPNLTKSRRAKLEADIKKLEAGIAAAKAALASVPTSKTVTITSRFITERITRNQTTDQGGHAVTPNANGGYYPHGIPSYADGKLPKQAMVQPGKGGGLVQWAEKETGGEAFIPLAPSKRDRSEKILGQVAGSFGLGLVKSFADGGLNLPGGRLTDIALILKQLLIPFNPSAGVNYGSTLAAQKKAQAAVAPAKNAANIASRAETAQKAANDKIAREITLQQRYITLLRGQDSKAKDPKVRAKENAAQDAKIRKEQQELIKLQDKLYVGKKKLTAATNASNKADAAYNLKADAAKKATEAHAEAIQKLIEQQKAAVEMANQIATALTSSANIGDLFAKSLTGKGLLQDLQAQGAAMKAFAAQVDKLRKLGLSEELISQIVGKGADQGGDLATAILNGGAGLVAALNKAQKALDDQANKIGAGSANAQYGQAIAGARGKGGPTAPEKAYLVGENGPEILRMGQQGGWVQPNQYVGGGGRGAGGMTTVIHEHRHYQENKFYGVSMAEADLIAQRANAKAELMAKGY